MEIYLIRHTTPNIEKGICYGQTNLGVVDSFYEEVTIIKEKLPDFKNFTVYSSPLKRCTLLANELFTNVPIIDERLMELNFGDWEMKEWNKIEKEKLDFWMNDFVNVACPNGESYVQLHKRVSNFIEEIKSTSLEKVCIVTHAGVIRSIHSLLNNIHLKNSFDLKVDYGQVIKFKL